MKSPKFLLSLSLLIFMGTNVHAGEGPSLGDLAIPESLGKIEERVQGKTDYWIIHIQDVHAHFSAQENIAAIVDHLNHAYKLETVALEGAWSQTTFDEIWGIPTSQEKQHLARELMERDYLTGPAYAALFAHSPMTLIGIEDQDVYEKNRSLFIEHLQNRDDTLKKLMAWKTKLETQKKVTFNSTLYTFDQHLQAFHAGKKAEQFIPALVDASHQTDVSFTDLSQMVLFENILLAEKGILKEKLQNESKRIMKQFKKTRLNFEELLRSGKVPEEKLEFYPETIKYMALMNLHDKLDPSLFFEQIDDLVGRIKEKLFLSEDEKSLDQASQREQIAHKILLLKATGMDLQKYGQHMMAFKQDITTQDLEKALDLALDFYKIAKERDQVFYDNLMANPGLKKNAAIVAGGFHTEGLTRLLKEAGVSYIVITPELGDGGMDEALYHKRMMQSLAPTQAIQTLLETTFMNPVFQKAFREALKVRIETRNVLKAIETIDAYLLGQIQEVQKKAKLEMEDFLKLSDEKQTEVIQELLDLTINSKMPIAIFGMQQDLILESELSLEAFRRVKSNRLNNLFVVVPDDDLIHDEVVTGRAKLRRVRANNLNEALDQPSIRRRIDSFAKNKQAAAIATNFQSAGLLVLPPEEIVLFFVRALLEGHLGISKDAGVRAEFWTRAREILMTLETFKHIQAAA